MATALSALGCRVKLADDEFAQTAKDSEWIPAVAAKGWVILSKDYDIRINESERLALFESGAFAFLLTQQGLTGPQMAQAFVTACPRIRSLIRSHAPPLIARVSPAGNVEVLYQLRKEWRKRQQRQRK